MTKFKDYIVIDKVKYSLDSIRTDEESLEAWDEDDFWSHYNYYLKFVIENLDRPVGTTPIDNKKNLFTTQYTNSVGTKYKFKADITGDMATISFHEKGSTGKDKYGAKRKKERNPDAITGVLESIKLLLKMRKDVNRLYFVSVDKDIERFTDNLIHWAIKKGKISGLKYDGFEKDIRGKKCHWMSRK